MGQTSYRDLPFNSFIGNVAKTIILSTGSVMYTNKIFFKLNANLIWIGQHWTFSPIIDDVISPLLKCIFTDSLILNKDEVIPNIYEFDKYVKNDV